MKNFHGLPDSRVSEFYGVERPPRENKNSRVLKGREFVNFHGIHILRYLMIIKINGIIMDIHAKYVLLQLTIHDEVAVHVRISHKCRMK